MFYPSSTFISLTMTMTDDNAHQLTQTDLPFYEVNLHCYTQDLYYGDGLTMGAYIVAGDVASFRNGNLRDLFFKNKTAGQNGTITAVATVPMEAIKKQLRF